MNNIIRDVVSFVLVVILLIIGVVGFKKFMSMKSAPPITQPVEGILRVETQIAKVGSYPEIIRAFGTVTERQRLTLAVEIPGRIVQRHTMLIAGGFVKNGELLIALDDSELRQQLTIASLEKQSLIIQRERLEADLVNLKKMEVIALADVSYASDEIKRIEPLTMSAEMLTVGAALPRTALDQAKAAQRRADSALLQIQRQIDSAPMQFNDITNRTALLDAKIETLNIQLKKYAIYCPFDALVLQSGAEVSQVVSPGLPLATLVEAYRREATIELFESQAAIVRQRLAAGETIACDIKLQGEALSRPARIDRLAPIANTMTRAVNAIVTMEALSAVDYATLPTIGEFVEISLTVRQCENVSPLPRSALTRTDANDPNDFVAYVVNPDGAGVSKPVQLEAQTDDGVLASGLSDGDRVVISQTHLLYDGRRVNFESAAAQQETR